MKYERVLFLHGLESRPHGHKFRALAKANFDVFAPDLSNKSLYERAEEALKVIATWGTTPYYIVGSSFGGLTAIVVSHLAGHQPSGLVLCAPALRHTEARLMPIRDMKVGCPVVIVHGTEDDVCPIGPSREYAKVNGAALIEVDDGHRLHNSDQVIVTALKEMIRKTD